MSLAKAFISARKEIKNPQFDSVNPHFKSRFASLRAVIESVIPVAGKHGIGVTQDIQGAEGGVHCVTHLIHESGEQMTYGPAYFPCTKNDAQGYASASTYARRYHLMAIFGVVGDDDDDGNAAAAASIISADQAANIQALIDEVGADKAAFLKVCKVKTLEELPASLYEGAVKRLEAKRK